MTTKERTGAKSQGCKTEVKEFDFEYKWSICDFLWTFEKMRSISSSTFAIDDCPITGYISIIPAHYQYHDSSTHAELRVTLINPNYKRLLAKVECSVINSQSVKQLIFTKETPEVIFSNETNYKHEFPVKDMLLENGTLTMLFEFTFKILSSAPSVIGIPSIIEQPVIMPECRSAYTFSQLPEDCKFSDVTITVGSKKFNVHRVILANRSSVFAAMFEHKMKENESSNVDITDISEEAVEEMLKFIYTDKTDKLEDMTNELLDAAEKYDLGTLKDLCVYSLRKNLNCSNAAESLILADRYNLKKTKIEILIFISHHRKLVVETDGYNVMREKYPRLLLETFEI